MPDRPWSGYAPPEGELLRHAGRGFVVRDLSWTVKRLVILPPFE
jgi:hypothetical protein